MKSGACGLHTSKLAVGAAAKSPVKTFRPDALRFPTVEFGTYPQGPAGEVAPIEWYVIDEEEGHRLLLARHVLDAAAFNEGSADVTWETCSLRAWLNTGFFDAAFSAEEQSYIVEVALANLDNPDWGTPGGNRTCDRVFCLSLEEAMGHFGVGRTWKQLRDELGDSLHCDDGSLDYEKVYTAEPGYKALVARATDYALAKEVWTWADSDNPFAGGSDWWLRSPGHSSGIAAYVVADGFVSSGGLDVGSSGVGVRPALWLNL